MLSGATGMGGVTSHWNLGALFMAAAYGGPCGPISIVRLLWRQCGMGGNGACAVSRCSFCVRYQVTGIALAMRYTQLDTHNGCDKEYLAEGLGDREGPI
jgi:hypothetical protein